MSPLRLSYLVLAVASALVPFWQATGWLRLNGWSLPGSLPFWWSSPDGWGLASDPAIAVTALTVWILAETRVRRNRSAPVAVCFGLGCGLPPFLFLRRRPGR